MSLFEPKDVLKCILKLRIFNLVITFRNANLM